MASGPSTAAKLDGLGIYTGADLKAQSLAFLQQHFGKSGSWYYAIARGEDDRAVESNRPRKSSGSETTFAEDRVQPAEIEAGVIEMADDVWTWCEKNESFGATVTVKIKYADFRIVTRSRTVLRPVTTRELLREISVGLSAVRLSRCDRHPSRRRLCLEIFRRRRRTARPGARPADSDSASRFLRARSFIRCSLEPIYRELQPSLFKDKSAC